jgi:hypothetical protein
MGCGPNILKEETKRFYSSDHGIHKGAALTRMLKTIGQWAPAGSEISIAPFEHLLTTG